MNEPPYQIHTNRELGLMLRGVKPLAMFAEEDDRTPECLARYLRMFERHVRCGRFLRRDHPVVAGRYRFRYIFFALPAEEWRMDGMIRLIELPGAWTDDREREQGRLLGYADWMNDVWIERRVARRQSDA